MTKAKMSITFRLEGERIAEFKGNNFDDLDKGLNELRRKMR